jgi:hypothetical protein
VVALEILSQICQRHGVDLAKSAARTFPHVNLSESVCMQNNANPLVRNHTERAKSSGSTMSTMFAVIQMFYVQENSYLTCVDQLKQAEAT